MKHQMIGEISNRKTLISNNFKSIKPNNGLKEMITDEL